MSNLTGAGEIATHATPVPKASWRQAAFQTACVLPDGATPDARDRQCAMIRALPNGLRRECNSSIEQDALESSWAKRDESHWRRKPSPAQCCRGVEKHKNSTTVRARGSEYGSATRDPQDEGRATPLAGQCGRGRLSGGPHLVAMEPHRSTRPELTSKGASPPPQH